MISSKCVVLLVMLACAGCMNPVQPLAEDDSPVTPETPLHFKLDAKNRVYIKDRWVELFSEHTQLVEYLKNRQEHYQHAFDQFEIGLRRVQRRSKVTSLYPVEVIIEVEAKTRSGAISALKRVCREHGFVTFTIKAPEKETQDDSLVVEQAKEAQSQEAASEQDK